MGRWTVASVALVLGASLMTLALAWERHLSPAERGKYLVRALGCDDCHSPKIPGPGGMPIPDATRLLHAITGAARAFNLTVAGIGVENHAV